MKDNNTGKKSTPWGVIILLLIVFSPIGIYLLISKLTIIKAAALKNSRTLSIIGWILIVFCVYFLIMAATGNVKTYSTSNISGSIIYAFVFYGGGGTFMVYFAHKMRVNALKFKKYIFIVGNQKQTSLDKIAVAIPTTYEKACTDLQHMINIGYFVDAYLDTNNRQIVLPNRKQSEDASLQQQIKAIECKNCGANNNVIVGQVYKCEYCDSIMNI